MCVRFLESIKFSVLRLIQLHLRSPDFINNSQQPFPLGCLVLHNYFNRCRNNNFGPTFVHRSTVIASRKFQPEVEHVHVDHAVDTCHRVILRLHFFLCGLLVTLFLPLDEKLLHCVLHFKGVRLYVKDLIISKCLILKQLRCEAVSQVGHAASR